VTSSAVMRKEVNRLGIGVAIRLVLAVVC